MAKQTTFSVACQSSIEAVTDDFQKLQYVSFGTATVIGPTSRYRPAAHAEAVDTLMSHLGFRCIVRKGEENEKG